MKETMEYQNADGSYDYDQVIVDAFDGDMPQYEAFLAERMNCRINGTPEPLLPEPYEALYRQTYALHMEWVEGHMPQLRRKVQKEHGFYPIVAIGNEDK